MHIELSMLQLPLSMQVVMRAFSVTGVISFVVTWIYYQTFRHKVSQQTLCAAWHGSMQRLKVVVIAYQYTVL